MIPVHSTLSVRQFTTPVHLEKVSRAILGVVDIEYQLVYLDFGAAIKHPVKQEHTEVESWRGDCETGKLLEKLSPDRFEEWYREREWRQNIEEGQPYFNGPGTIPEPERHSPSQFLHFNLVEMGSPGVDTGSIRGRIAR